MKVLFFAPVFNQVRELPRLLSEWTEFAQTRPRDVELLLVNNGSTDGSEVLVRESGHPYIDLPRNLGVGYGYIAAIDWALERGYEVFGAMAANGKMLPAEIPRLLAPIEEGRADWVNGSRFMPGGSSPNLPGFRRGSIPLVNVFVRVAAGAALTDSTCGFRAFRLDLLERAEFDWHAPWLHTYGFEYYLYAKALLDGRLRCLEVPVTMRYPEAGRYTKIRAGRDWWAMLKPWLVARLDGKGFRPA